MREGDKEGKYHTLRGRQILRMVYDDFKCPDKMKTLMGLLDMEKLQWLGDSIPQQRNFLEVWEELEQNMNPEVPRKDMVEVLANRMEYSLLHAEKVKKWIELKDTSRRKTQDALLKLITDHIKTEKEKFNKAEKEKLFTGKVKQDYGMQARQQVCASFLRGNCRNGDNCPNAHPPHMSGIELRVGKDGNLKGKPKGDSKGGKGGKGDKGKSDKGKGKGKDGKSDKGKGKGDKGKTGKTNWQTGGWQSQPWQSSSPGWQSTANVLTQQSAAIGKTIHCKFDLTKAGSCKWGDDCHNWHTNKYGWKKSSTPYASPRPKGGKDEKGKGKDTKGKGKDAKGKGKGKDAKGKGKEAKGKGDKGKDAKGKGKGKPKGGKQWGMAASDAGSDASAASGVSLSPEEKAEKQWYKNQAKKQKKKDKKAAAQEDASWWSADGWQK